MSRAAAHVRGPAHVCKDKTASVLEMGRVPIPRRGARCSREERGAGWARWRAQRPRKGYRVADLTGLRWRVRGDLLDGVRAGSLGCSPMAGPLRVEPVQSAASHSEAA